MKGDPRSDPHTCLPKHGTVGDGRTDTVVDPRTVVNSRTPSRGLVKGGVVVGTTVTGPVYTEPGPTPGQRGRGDSRIPCQSAPSVSVTPQSPPLFPPLFTTSVPSTPEIPVFFSDRFRERSKETPIKKRPKS